MLIVNPAYPSITENMLVPGYWGELARPVSVGGRGGAWFVTTEFGDMVLREYRRGGWAARISAKNYLFSGWCKTRSYREFSVLEALFRKGLPVPEPIAARAVRRGIFYQADILLKRIVGAVPWPEASNAVDKDLWFDIGTTIRRFHDAGLNHVDLNCDNVLVGNGHVYLIDFDKCDIRRTEPGGLVKWKLKNLARLHRSLAKRMGAVDIESLWGSLMDGYHGASHKGKSSRRDSVLLITKPEFPTGKR